MRGNDIEIVKTTAPEANNAPSYDVIFHLEPTPPPGWHKAFLKAWNGGGMPVPLPQVEIRGASIAVKAMTLKYVKDMRIAAAVKLAIERADPIYAEQIQAEAEDKRRRAQESRQRHDENDSLLADINRQLAD